MLRLSVAVAIALFAVAADRPVSAEEIGNRFPGSEWDRTNLAAVGWSSDILKQAEAWSKTIGSTAVMVIHHGAVVPSLRKIKQTLNPPQGRVRLNVAKISVGRASRDSSRYL